MRIEDEATLARFKREVQLARTVTHPNVCRIFDLHRHHDPALLGAPESGRVVTFLTMENVAGEALTEYLARRGALSAAEALPIVRQVAAALTAAHKKGVVHRDLKPGNVILADEGAESGPRAVVTDFGLALPLAQATESTVTIVGTPAYMAPEQLEGKPVTAAADIYAFGVLLYEMVVGRRPFAGESPIALALAKIREAPPRAGDTVPALPPVWSAVIARCMDPHPEYRFASIEDALRPLEQSVNRPPLIRLSRAAKRAIAGAALLAVLLAVAAWRYTQSVYAPGGEALRLYRSGTHAQQLGLPWKATQLLEKALEHDPRFVAARVRLADAWMDLEQPVRAGAELQRAGAMRPRWRRLASHDLLVEQAAVARLRGDLTGSAQLYQRATSAAPSAEAADLRFGAAAAKARAGDIAGAIAGYATLADGHPCQGVAILARAILSDVPRARRRFVAAESCFESGGDLDGLAQSWYESGRMDWEARFSRTQTAATIAQASGNIEQQILMAALLGEELLESGDDEASYESFAKAMQLADRGGLPFFSARLLSDRAAYFFAKGDFLQSQNFNVIALALSQPAHMPWTYARCATRTAKLLLIMHFPSLALNSIADAEEQLRQFPNAALYAELAQLTEQAKHTPARPEDSAFRTAPTK
jgi:tetratricopeptide (TPR) repeat protein